MHGVGLRTTSWTPPSFARRAVCWLSAGPYLGASLQTEGAGSVSNGAPLSRSCWRWKQWSCTLPLFRKGHSGPRCLLESARASATASGIFWVPVPLWVLRCDQLTSAHGSLPLRTSAKAKAAAATSHDSSQPWEGQDAEGACPGH